MHFFYPLTSSLFFSSSLIRWCFHAVHFSLSHRRLRCALLKKMRVKWISAISILDKPNESQEIAVHGTWKLALTRPPMTRAELARETSCLPAATSYSGERGSPPDTYRGDQREARLVRNLYHIFLLYTSIVPSLSSSSQNRFRSVRGRAQ